MRIRFGLLVVCAACGYHAPPPAPDANPGVPTINFEVPDSGADEKSGIVHVQVTLTGPAAITPVMVNYAVSGGTATPGQDFNVTGSMLTFDVGETVKAIDIMIDDDGIENEAAETIELELSNPVGANLGEAKLHRVTISDHVLPRVQFMEVSSTTAENQPTMLTLTLDKPSEGASMVVVGVVGAQTPDFPATPGVDTAIIDGTVVNIADGATTAVVGIGEVNDDSDEEDEKLVFSLRSPSTNLVVGNLASSTHIITDNDNPPTIGFAIASTNVTEGSQASVTVDVTVSPPSGKPVSVNFTIAGQSATATNDAAVATTTVDFAPGDATKQITVLILNDQLDENDETFRLTLTQATNATINNGAATHDVVITDDDPAPTVAFTASTSTKDDDDAQLAVTISVVISAASEKAISVTWAVNGSSTASDPGDYSISTSNTLSFPVGGGLQKSITVDVVGNGGGMPEPDQTVILDLKSPTNATLAAPMQHTLTITD